MGELLCRIQVRIENTKILHLDLEKWKERMYENVCSTTPLTTNLRLLVVQGCFWYVWGRFGRYLGEMFGEVWGACLGGFRADFERFLDSCREDV